MASFTTSGNTSTVKLPARSLRATKRSPLASVIFCSWLTSRLFFLAKASNAAVGWPLASSAILAYGPNTSECCVACSAFTASIRTAKRRGEYKALLESTENVMPRFVSPAETPSANACAKPAKAFGGNSSVPSSINKDCVFMPGPPLNLESRASRAVHNRILPPPAKVCERAEYSAVVQSPKWRVAHQAY